MMKKVIVGIAVLFSFAVFTDPAVADERATIDEVYAKVVDAATVLEQLGEDGLEAFSDPVGEFVWKDTYVVVFNCQKIVSHPINKLIGLPVEKIRCYKTGTPVIPENCKDITEHGIWAEYWWPRLENDQVDRKLMFTIPVRGTEWYVSAGIYDNTTLIKNLNRRLK